MVTGDHTAARHYLANLPAGDRRFLRHLLACPVCRGLLERQEAAARAALPPGVAAGAEDGAPCSEGGEAESNGAESGEAEGSAAAAGGARLAGSTGAASRTGFSSIDRQILAKVSPHLLGLLIGREPGRVAEGTDGQPPAGAPGIDDDAYEIDLGAEATPTVAGATGDGIAPDGAAGELIPAEPIPADTPAPTTAAFDLSLMAEIRRANPESDLGPRGRLAALLLLRLPEQCRTTEAERQARARQLLADLTMVPPRRRRLAVRRDESFQQPLLARLLLHQADRLLHQAVAEGRDRDLPPHPPDGPLARRAEAAELALAVAERLPRRPAAEVHPLAAEALALCGRVWTHLGAERRAERYLSRLAALTVGARAAPAARAALCTALAQLHWRRARFDEAAALFDRAHALWTAAGEGGRAALARAQLGFVHLDAGMPDADLAAASALHVAHVQLDPAVPALSARIALALACCRMALGDRGRAAELRLAAAAIAGVAGEAGEVGGREQPAAATEAAGAVRVPLASDPAERLARQWWSARIELAAGHAEAAVEGFEAVHAELLAHGTLGEAARAGLDLAQARLAAGRPAGLTGLGWDLVLAFGDRWPAFAERLAGLFRRPWDEGGVAAGTGLPRDGFFGGGALRGLRDLRGLGDLGSLGDLGDFGDFGDLDDFGALCGPDGPDEIDELDDIAEADDLRGLGGVVRIRGLHDRHGHGRRETPAALAALRAALWRLERQVPRRGPRQPPPYIRPVALLAELHPAARRGA